MTPWWPVLHQVGQQGRGQGHHAGSLRCWRAGSLPAIAWVLLQIAQADAYPQPAGSLYRVRDFAPTGFDRVVSPCPNTTKKAMVYPSPANCTKLIYLHIPKCGGHSVTPTLSRVPGFEFLYHRTYEFSKLYVDEVRDPLARRNLGFEIHFSGPPYVRIHNQLMRLRQRYQKAGCRVAMVALYRKPADLLQSWHSYRTKAMLKSRENRQLVYPGFLSHAAQCGRQNVLVNWLKTNSWSRRVTHQRSTVLEMANMLNQFDILDDLDNFDAWLIRVLDFLQVPRDDGCKQVSWVNYTAPVAKVPKILLDVDMPRVPSNIDICKVNHEATAYLYETLTKIDQFAGRTVPPSVMADLTRWDRVLYNALRAQYGKRAWGGSLRQQQYDRSQL